jgi:hypothetical protein
MTMNSVSNCDAPFVIYLSRLGAPHAAAEAVRRPSHTWRHRACRVLVPEAFRTIYKMAQKRKKKKGAAVPVGPSLIDKFKAGYERGRLKKLGVK